MYLTGHAINYGFGRIEIDNETVGIEDAYRQKQGSLFKSVDYAIPLRCGRARVACPLTRHVVRVTVMNKTSNPDALRPGVKQRRGFGVNSIMCM